MDEWITVNSHPWSGLKYQENKDHTWARLVDREGFICEGRPRAVYAEWNRRYQASIQ
jgi:hypothetical protein